MQELKKKAPISITKIALEKIREIKSAKEIGDDYYLRLGVKSAGCGVASFVLGFDRKEAGDELFEWDGLELIIEKRQVMYLAGKQVDYGQSDGEVGFVFRGEN